MCCWLRAFLRPGPTTFRQFSEPASQGLLAGFVLMAALMIAVPEGSFGLDNNSYYVLAHQLFCEGVVELKASLA